MGIFTTMGKKDSFPTFWFTGVEVIIKYHNLYFFRVMAHSSVCKVCIVFLVHACWFTFLLTYQAPGCWQIWHKMLITRWHLWCTLGPSSGHFAVFQTLALAQCAKYGTGYTNALLKNIPAYQVFLQKVYQHTRFLKKIYQPGVKPLNLIPASQN